jgi:exopolyphosphatase / guanosine-5'-triphosphate,3'-diphosphate pyrophosphatase
VPRRLRAAAAPNPDPGRHIEPQGSPAPTGPYIGASVDLGATSVHLLVAAVDAQRLTPLLDESVFLELGRTVADRGLLGRDARGELVAALAAYAATARGLGAGAVTLVGTEPIRRAADAAVIVAEAGAAADAPLHVLSHEEEAFLTILGVLAGRPVRRETLVVDIGGGSSEFCVVEPGERPRASGIRLGASSLTDRHVTHDPPTADEFAAMAAEAAAAMVDAPVADPAEIAAVGGTVSNLVKLVPVAGADQWLGRERIAAATEELLHRPASVISEHFLVNPRRAGILAGGAAIVTAILDRYGLERLRVVDAGIREGTILAVAQAGPVWRDRLVELTLGRGV